MKKFLSLAITLVFASSMGVAQAGHIGLSVVQTTDGSGNTIDAISLTGLTLADEVTALSFEAVPGDGVEFLNFSENGFNGFSPRPGGDEASFTNALLDLGEGPPFNGQGWGIIPGSTGVPADPSAAGIGWAASKAGSFMVADGTLIANLMLPAGARGSAFVVLIGSNGQPIAGEDNLGAALGVPEPGTLALAGLSLAGVLGVRRRRSC